MISCIISSVSNSFLNQVTESIKATIDVPFEIIAINNRKGEKGICEVYNNGAEKAKYPFLCFLHEDVLFETQGWGKNALKHFEDNTQLGMIGVAGCKIKSDIISSWFIPETNSPSPNRYNYKASSKKSPDITTSMYMNPDEEILSEVVCLDGVFLLTQKNIWEKYKFDETLLRHFHGYDLDFSLHIQQHFKIAVAYDILLTHVSDGYANDAWVKETFKVYIKWKNKLPLFSGHGVDLIEQAQIDSNAFQYCLGILRKKKNTFFKQVSLLFHFVPILYKNQTRKERFIILFHEIKISTKYLFKMA